MTDLTSIASARHADLAGRRCWIISDGKAGNDAQAYGVATALGLDIELKRVAPQGVYRLLAPYGPVAPAEDFGGTVSPFQPPWPDFAIATGRLTTPYVRRLKREAKLATYTLILLDPRTSSRSADLFWVPAHDRRRGPNVITTLTAPHVYAPARLERLRAERPAWLGELRQPRVAVLLGGPNGDYSYPEAVVERLADNLVAIAHLGFGLMITASRRTPASLLERLKRLAPRPSHYLWDGSGDNPYASFLAHADAFVVTADSVNMTGEAAATGKPIYVFRPEGGSAKFARFHVALTDHGATRELPDVVERLDTWSYPPLFAADSIAEAVVERWRRRRHLLGGIKGG